MATKSTIPHRAAETVATGAEGTAPPAENIIIGPAESPLGELTIPAPVWTPAPPLDEGWYWWTNARRYVRPVRVFRSGGALLVEYVGQDLPLTAFHSADTRWAGPIAVPAPPEE